MYESYAPKPVRPAEGARAVRARNKRERRIREYKATLVKVAIAYWFVVAACAHDFGPQVAPLFVVAMAAIFCVIMAQKIKRLRKM